MTDTATRLSEAASTAPEWHDRPGREHIAPDRWGRDHWNLLGYIETREVVRHGQLDWQSLKPSAKNWPTLYATRPRSIFDSPSDPDAADEYGLRLKLVNGKPVTLYGHCEADALMDLADAGLLTIEMPRASSDRKYFLDPAGRPLTDRGGVEMPRPGFLTGLGETQLMPYARFRLTERGRAVAYELRAYKETDGATWSGFQPESLPAAQAAATPS